MRPLEQKPFHRLSSHNMHSGWSFDDPSGPPESGIDTRIGALIRQGNPDIFDPQIRSAKRPFKQRWQASQIQVCLALSQGPTSITEQKACMSVQLMTETLSSAPVHLGAVRGVFNGSNPEPRVCTIPCMLDASLGVRPCTCQRGVTLFGRPASTRMGQIV